ncbi:MAG: tyrosine-type recombinase/integrase [Bacteroidota bacterium]|nr:tyrosine-type recombinase/integrase [Bacteroidota bacterium]MDP4289463.1 tyrosine-type recombinase/integrase [Bacteroidota bacterium]
MSKKGKSFYQHLTEHIENIVSLKGRRAADNYYAMKSILEEFCKDKKEPSFETVDINFYMDLMDYMIYEKGSAINYAGTVGSKLKAFMNATYLKKLHTNIDFNQFKKMSEDVDTVALEEDEVRQFATAPLTGHWDWVRDIFIVQCFTGLRFSDAVILQSENTNKGFLSTRSLKTGKTMMMSINPYVSDILEKYNGFPPQISNQKLNKYLKEAAHLAKLKRPVTISTKRKGQTTKTNYELWEVISSHTGRRTCFTNMARAGIPLREIKNFSGHSSIALLEKYLKIGNEETAKGLQDHPFFTNR